MSKTEMTKPINIEEYEEVIELLTKHEETCGKDKDIRSKEKEFDDLFGE